MNQFLLVLLFINFYIFHINNDKPTFAPPCTLHNNILFSLKVENPAFVTTWMGLEDIMLSEMSDRQRKILHFSHAEFLKAELIGIAKRMLPGSWQWRWGDVGERVQTPNHQMSKVWGSNAQHGYCIIQGRAINRIY